MTRREFPRPAVLAVVAAVLAAVLSGCSGGSAGAVGGPATPAQLKAPPAAPSGGATPSGSAPARRGTSGPATAGSAPSGSAAASTPPRDAEPSVAGVVASGLRAPWGLAFLPDGDALVAERDTARVVRVSAGGRVTPVGEVPGVDPGGEGGLLGLAVSPSFARDRLVYAYFTAARDNRIVRMRYDGTGLGAPEVLLDGLEKGTIHNGGRIAFGPDGMLYVGVGDAGDSANAQDRGSRNGKILRITPDGKAAPGNPFGDSPVYSLGHRNVQGLAWDAQGRLWASEFGQNTYDELNLIRPGRNYGWPDVEGTGGGDRFTDPKATWPTSENSPSGIAITGDAVYMAALRGSRLWRIPIADGEAGRPQDFLVEEYGRLRTVAVAPDGSLWVTTSNRDGRGAPRDGDDKILRVVLH